MHNLCNKKIGFLGCGNMGKALLKGWLHSAVIRAENILIAAKTTAKETAQTFGVTHATPQEVILQSEIIILAIKPQQLHQCLKEWFTDSQIHLQDGCYMISLLAGTSQIQIQNLLPKHLPVIRVMPNLPTKIALGITLQHTSPTHNSDQTKECQQLFESVGHVEFIHKEEDFHVATAIAGSGPAYFAMIIEALSDAGVYGGLSRQKAQRLACHSMQGSAAMSLNMPPSELKDQVSSPAGVSIYAVESLELNGLRGILMQAIKAATQRSREM